MRAVRAVELSRVVLTMGAAMADDEADRAGKATDVPTRLCTAFNTALDGQGAVLALMADSTHHRHLAASHPAAAALGQLEFDLGEGPGLEAFARRRPVLVGDLAGAEGERWPVWSATAVNLGLPTRAVFAYPLRISGTGFGIVELHRHRPGTLDEMDRAAAGIAADLTALALARSFTEPTQDAPGDPSWMAAPDLDEVEVDQAIGMVMAQLRAPAETALSVLRARAFADGRTLGEVARDVLARKISLRPGEEEQG